MLIFLKGSKLFGLTLLLLANSAHATMKHAEMTAADGMAWPQLEALNHDKDFL